MVKLRLGGTVLFIAFQKHNSHTQQAAALGKELDNEKFTLWQKGDMLELNQNPPDLWAPEKLHHQVHLGQHHRQVQLVHVDRYDGWVTTP